MRSWGSAAAVIAALRDEASAEAERSERQAAAAIEALRAAPPAAPSRPDAEAVDRVVAARRFAIDLEGEDDWQDAMTAAVDRDGWILAVAEAGRRAIVARPDLTWLAAVAEEAARQLPGPVCILTIPPMPAGTDVNGWRLSLETAVGKQIILEQGALGAGCVARTPDGRVTFDNTLEARERRLLTDWRSALARIYDAAVAPDAVTSGMEKPRP